MIDTVRSVMAKQEDVLWCNEASWVTINVAIRAVVGELLTMEAAEKIFPLFETMASGCLALVRSTCLQYDLHRCAQPVSRLLSTGAHNLFFSVARDFGVLLLHYLHCIVACCILVSAQGPCDLR
jgi:hypothetical protein